MQTNIYTGTVITSLGAKDSIYNTLAHRAIVESHNQQSLHKEVGPHKESSTDLSFPNAWGH